MSLKFSNCNNDLISIIVPVYNVELYIDKCLKSLVNQTYKNTEIILVDDGSTDNSSIICDNYSANYDNVKVIHQRNSGVSAARNKALDNAKGKYIYFVDPDDWCEPNTIEILYNSLKGSDADLAYCGMFINKKENVEIIPPSMKNSLTTFATFGNNGNQYIVDISESLPLHLFGTFASALYRRMFKHDLIEKYNIRFDTKIFKAEDWLFYTQYLSRSSKEIIVDIPLYHYYQREGSIINTYYEENETGIEKGRYILQQFEYYLQNAEIPQEWYYIQLSQRYFQSILRYSVNIWNFKNKRSVYGKYKKVNMYIKTYIPYSKINIRTLSLCQKIMLKTKSALLLSIYGLAFNIAKLAMTKYKFYKKC